jgi:hypothetical protein
VTDHLLLQVFTAMWDGQEHDAPLESGEFKSHHYDSLNQYFSGYPEDLWPFYIKALVHYQRVEPDSDLVSHLFEDNPQMAHFMIKQLSKECAAHEDHAESLKAKLEAEEAKVATLSKKVRDVLDICMSSPGS